MIFFPLIFLVLQSLIAPPLSLPKQVDEEHPPLELEQDDNLARIEQKLRELLQGRIKVTIEGEGFQLNLKEPFAGDYLAARVAEAEGDAIQASRYWGKLAERYPDQTYVLTKAIPLLVIVGNTDKVLDLLGVSDNATLKKHLEDGQLLDNSQVALILFTNLINRKDFKTADLVLKKFTPQDIYTIAKPILQAWLLAQDQKTEEAVVLLNKAQEKTIANQDFLFVHKALLLHAMHAAPIIIEKAYRDALDRTKYPYYILIEEYGRFLEEQGRIDEAKQHYQKYADQFDPLWIKTIEERLKKGERPFARIQSPTDGMGLVMDMLADYFGHDGILLPTLLYSQLALQLDPMIESALYRQGIVWASLKNYDKALHFLSLIPVTSNFYLDAQLKIAQVLEKKEDLNGVIQSLQQLSNNLNDRIEPPVMLGDILRRHDRFTEAAQAYQKAIERISQIEKGHWGIVFSLAITQERAGNWDDAEKNLLKALELAPDQAEVLNYLGYSWADRNINLDKAFDLLQKAADLRPDDGAILDSLGWAYYQKGNYRKALEYLEKAIILEPGDPVINDHLGDVYWRLGRKDEAYFQWERVFVYEPDEKLAATVREKLEKGLPEEK